MLGLFVAVGLAEVVARAFGIAREIGPSFTEWHVREGVQVRRNLRATRVAPEFTMRFSANADGCRGPELPASIARSIVCFGDSFTMGYGVDDGEEFPALLAAKVPADWTVVNAGIGGTGNGRWLHVLARARARWKPRIVLLQVCGNDFDDNLLEQLFTVDAAGQLESHDAPPPTLGRRIQVVVDQVPGLSHLHLLALGRQFAARMRRGGAAPPTVAPGAAQTHPGRALTHAILRQCVADVRAAGAVPLVISCEVPRPELAALEALFGELQVRLLVIPTRAERPDLYYKVDGHWNRRGHVVAADLIWAELQQECYGLAHGPR